MMGINPYTNDMKINGNITSIYENKKMIYKKKEKISR
jgi:hypothetical protein